MIDYITPIKKLLEIGLHSVSRSYSEGKKPLSNSPRWFNFGGFDSDTKELTLQSTLNSRIFFKINTGFDFIEVDEFWVQFRNFRTEFLEQHYTNIKTF